jgi:hypothetical protein
VVLPAPAIFDERDPVRDVPAAESLDVSDASSVRDENRLGVCSVCVPAAVGVDTQREVLRPDANAFVGVNASCHCRIRGKVSPVALERVGDSAFLPKSPVRGLASYLILYSATTIKPFQRGKHDAVNEHKTRAEDV